LPTTPQGQQQQQRTFDVLRKPDIFKSYRQIAGLARDPARGRLPLPNRGERNGAILTDIMGRRGKRREERWREEQ